MRTRAAIIQEIKVLLGEKEAKRFIDDKKVIGVSKETFQSKVFIEAGFHLTGGGDRFLYTVMNEDNTQVIVVSGKISSDNPYEVGHASADGLDLRKTQTTVYLYNGKEIITEIPARGKTREYTGNNGNPDFLLHHVRRAFGKLIAQEVC